MSALPAPMPSVNPDQDPSNLAYDPRISAPSLKAANDDVDTTVVTNIEDLRSKQATQVVRLTRTRNNPDRKEYNEVHRETPVVYIPDIHGDINALKNSLRALGMVDMNDEWIGRSEVLVFSGDYIDRGSSNLEVLQYLSELREKAEAWGGTVEFLIGNHEAMMIGAVCRDQHMFNNWISQGGDKVLFEVMDEYNCDKEEALFRLYSLTLTPIGKFSDLFSSMTPFHQVDDVLYVHAGISLPWAEKLAKEGVDGVNAEWSDALTKARNGDVSGIKKFAEAGKSRLAKGADTTGYPDVGGPFWADFNQELEQMTDGDIQKIAKHLKSIGINAIMVGHARIKEPRVAENFLRNGIILVGSDVGVSNYYNKTSGKGGVVVNKNGDIEAESNNSAHVLYKNPKRL